MLFTLSELIFHRTANVSYVLITKSLFHIEKDFHCFGGFIPINHKHSDFPVLPSLPPTGTEFYSVLSSISIPHMPPYDMAHTTRTSVY